MIAIIFAIAGCGHATKSIDRASVQATAPQTAAVASAPPSEPISPPEPLLPPEPSPAPAEVVPEIVSGPPLPPLPRPKPVPRADKFAVPTPAPAKPCPSDEGWNGVACTTLVCPSRMHFIQGKGCVGKNPERRFVSHDGPPFDRKVAEQAVRGVAYRHCLPRGLTSTSLIVTFRPNGVVDDVELRDGASPTAEACLWQAFESLRIEPFRGSTEHVFLRVP